MNLSFFRLFIICSLGTDEEWKREWAYSGGLVIVLPSLQTWAGRLLFALVKVRPAGRMRGCWAWRCRGVRPGEVAAVCTHSEAASRLHSHPLAWCWERAPPTPPPPPGQALGRSPPARLSHESRSMCSPPPRRGPSSRSHVLNVKCGQLAQTPMPRPRHGATHSLLLEGNAFEIRESEQLAPPPFFMGCVSTA